jgi:hypothetical protein
MNPPSKASKPVPRTKLEVGDGTLLLHNAPEEVPEAKWDDRVAEYRAQAYRYRTLLEWVWAWTSDITLPAERAVEPSRDHQATLHQQPVLIVQDRGRRTSLSSPRASRADRTA